jgi:transcriptional regulator with XRE-family HTH domain
MLVKQSVTVEDAFGRALRVRRKALDLSQEELALEAGVDRNFVSLLERGRNQPSLSTIFKLCVVLKISPSTIVKDVELTLSNE